MPAQRPVTLRSLGVRGLLLTVAAQAVVSVVLILLGASWPALVFPWLLVLAFAARLRATVIIDDLGISTRQSGGQQFAWADLLAISWQNGIGLGGSGPVVRPRGGPYDIPGPNALVVVASLSLSRGAQRSARAALKEAAGAHGVPWSDDLGKMLHPRRGKILSP